MPKKSKKNILIVEDSIIVSMELKEKLKKEGYIIVGCATSGEEAITLFKNKHPDLVLMDIMLEGEMTGIETSTEIQKIYDVPIIYTTAYSDDETVRELQLTNPYAFLKKPYDTKELLIAIDLSFKRYEYQKKIAASEFKYKSLFENSVDAIFLMDKKGRLIDFNISLIRLTGCPREILVKTSLVDFFVRKGDLKKLGKKINDEGLVQDYNVSIKNKDEDLLSCQITATSLYIEEINDFGYQGLIRDITEQKKNEEKQKNLIIGMIKAMAATLEARDPYTAGHQARVAEISMIIAKELGLSDEKCEEIRMAGMIHDLGKIYIPSEILSKPTKLSDSESQLMQTHPQVGYDILKDIDFPFDLAQIVYQHHERFDGSGYPKGLKKDEILLEARIICVSDVVEAMASDRPYRPAIGIDVAIDEIMSKKGKSYDPKVADAFYKVYKANKLDSIIIK